ncbi:hypothetical protein PV619_003848 [Salmonella enterica]|nr:hypothetical protein [Salmonella enterica]
MLLSDCIAHVYGSSRKNRACFLKDNPDILPRELSRWLKAGLKIRPERLLKRNSLLFPATGMRKMTEVHAVLLKMQTRQI